MIVSLTICGAGLSKPQLQTCSSWVLFAAIWWIYKPVQIPLKGVQQSPDHGEVGLVYVNELLKYELKIKEGYRICINKVT